MEKLIYGFGAAGSVVDPFSTAGGGNKASSEKIRMPYVYFFLYGALLAAAEAQRYIRTVHINEYGGINAGTCLRIRGSSGVQKYPRRSELIWRRRAAERQSEICARLSLARI